MLCCKFSEAKGTSTIAQTKYKLEASKRMTQNKLLNNVAIVNNKESL